MPYYAGLLIGSGKKTKFCAIFSGKFAEKSAHFAGIFGANFAENQNSVINIFLEEVIICSFNNNTLQR